VLCAGYSLASGLQHREANGDNMINRLLPWDGLGHEVVAHGGVIYIGGIVAEDTSLGMEGQADDVLRQFAKLLTAGGSSIARVLQVTIYATNLEEKPSFNRAWKAHFREVDLPARAMIGVADLGPGVKLELVATAAVAG
jgi:enamine deaminase RidA (YjgF/YER057c/UK114 family)